MKAKPASGKSIENGTTDPTSNVMQISCSLKTAAQLTGITVHTYKVIEDKHSTLTPLLVTGYEKSLLAYASTTLLSV